jgi:putative DNA primase/helicase
VLGTALTIWATEMSGVLNRALAGLARVISRGWRFDPPETAQEAKEEWLIEANPLPAFIDARCEPKGACWLSDLYNEFLSWAKGMGSPTPSRSPPSSATCKAAGS